jgi:hypothetical protein
LQEQERVVSALHEYLSLCDELATELADGTDHRETRLDTIVLDLPD